MPSNGDVRQYRLGYLVRGPRYAFAVPQGDLDALRDVAEICSEFWNGVNSRVVPVRRDGRVPKWIEELRDIEDFESCYIHDSLGGRARDSLREKLPDVREIYPGFVDDEVHPLHLAPEPPARLDRTRVARPKFSAAGLDRFAAIVWGSLDESELSYWYEVLDVYERHDAEAHGALVASQVDSRYTSPLRLSGEAAPVVKWAAPAHHPVLYVLNARSFDDLVWFWNSRASRGDILGRPAVAAVPREALDHPQSLASLGGWVTTPSWTQANPDLIVMAMPPLQAKTRNALEELGFEESRANRIQFSMGTKVEPRERPTFIFAMPPNGGEISRGLRSEAVVTFANRRARLALSAPPNLPLKQPRHVRLELVDLPAGFPLCRTSAQKVIANSYLVDSSLTIHTDAQRSWNLDIEIPDSWELLVDWSRERGFEVEVSQDGRYANALLDRLGREDLRELAGNTAVAVLTILAPQSRKKLAQRLVEEFQSAGRQLDETALAGELKDGEISLDQPALDLNALSSETGKSRKRIGQALHGLITKNFVQVGFERRCPRCNFRQFHGLDDVADLVRCPACRESFAIALNDDGSKEAVLRYRLDGLMARAMDQDLLPVLLALNALRPSVEDRPWAAWPGLLFRRDGREVDADLVVSDGERVDICECKAAASSLSDDQLARIRSLADSLGARLHLAALSGKFSRDLGVPESRLHEQQELLG